MTEAPPPRQADHSWWLEEALAQDPGTPCPPLSTEIEADVVIVGGGYTGLWTAHFLKERDPGIEIVVLDQDVCGGGPSGRNGGFVNALWEELPYLVQTLGEEPALRTARIAERSIPALGAWCERHGVDAWFTPNGQLGVATSASQDGAWRETLDVARRLGEADDRLVELSDEEVSELCRSPVFRAGILTARTATLQPARLVRALRRVVLEQGVRIFEGSPVRRFRGGPPAEADTLGGRVRAPRALLAAGAWASQWRRFRRTILPRGSYIVMTEPAPEKLTEIGWTGGEGIYDFRTALHYLRTTPDGRIAFGAASPRAGLGAGLGPRLMYDPVSIRRLIRDLHRMFPSFADVPLDCAWGGPIDVTALHLPFFGTLGKGNVHYGLGFTGGGVGPCHMAGRVLSGLILDARDEYTSLPLIGLEPKPFPPEPLLSPGAFLTHEAIVRKDEAEDEGRKTNPVVDFAARLPRRLGYRIGP